MENLDIVAILGTGATGFSFLMLFIGYKLTSDIQNKILDTSLLDLDPSKINAWEKMAEKQINNTRVFLAFTLVFLIAGLAILTYRPEAKIILSISPVETEHPFTVYAQNEPVVINKDGKGMVIIKSEHGLSIENPSVFSTLAQLKTELKALTASENSLVQRLADESNDSGFGSLL